MVRWREFGGLGSREIDVQVSLGIAEEGREEGRGELNG